MIAIQSKSGTWFSEFRHNPGLMLVMRPVFVEVRNGSPEQVCMFSDMKSALDVVESLKKFDHEVTVRDVLSESALSMTPKRTRIVPVKPDIEGRIVARSVVYAVYDTNGDGALIPVSYRSNPLDGVEVKLVYAPRGQIYVQVEEK